MRSDRTTSHGDGEVIGPTHARQGILGRPILLVLSVSLLLAALALLGAWLFYADELASGDGGAASRAEPAEAQLFTSESEPANP